MRRLILGAAMLLCIAAPGISSAQNGVGLGVIVGEPTGVSAKIWTGTTRAVDLGLAWSFADEGGAAVHGDYLFHNFTALSVRSGALPIYYGLGLRAVFGNQQDSRFGVRAPVGLEYIFNGSRSDLFVEVAPLLDLTPATDLRMDGAIGMRYFFQ